MFDNGATTALAGLVTTDLTVADHGELAAAARSIAQVQAFVDLAKVQISRRTRQLADEGDRSSDHVLLDEARLTGKDAKANDEREKICDNLPEFESALAHGDCTAGHLDSLAHHTKGLTDDERADLQAEVDDLLDHATNDPVSLFDRKAKGIVDRIRARHRPESDADELARQRKASNVKRWTDRETGMKHTLVALDPLRDAALWNVIDHHLGRLRREPANADRPFAELQMEAFIAAVQPTSDGDAAARIPEIVVHVDHETACHGRHDDTVCETIDGEPMPPSTTQRLCCEAIVQAVIVNPDGTIDQLCAERRTANRAQRRMLAAMYRTCAHPHCEVGFSQCRIHHIEWFTNGGRTVLANLLPLCETHHHLVHEGGWSLTIDDDRRVTWWRPDGTVWHIDHRPSRAPASSARPSTSANDATPNERAELRPLMPTGPPAA